MRFSGLSNPFTLPNPRWWSTVLPLLFYCLVIFYFSSQTRFFIRPPEFFSSDKIYHFFEYTFLGILAARVIRAYTLDFRALPPVGAVTLFCLMYGAGDEFHQWFVPGRWATVGDILADTVGGWAGGKLYLNFWFKPSQKGGWEGFLKKMKKGN
jgi:VanZ family protein